MELRVLCVGRLKEKYWRDACAEYEKRLSRFARVSIIEAPDQSAPEQLSEAGQLKVREKESAQLLSALRPGEYLIALCLEGEEMDSPALSQRIDALCVSGRSQVAFMIGGSLGLSNEAKARADLKLSFSKLTFPHQMMRPMLLEQIYRAFAIGKNLPYHK